jgi:hypothetical protein
VTDCPCCGAELVERTYLACPNASTVSVSYTTLCGRGRPAATGWSS